MFSIGRTRWKPAHVRIPIPLPTNTFPPWPRPPFQGELLGDGAKGLPRCVEDDHAATVSVARVRGCRRVPLPPSESCLAGRRSILRYHSSSPVAAVSANRSAVFRQTLLHLPRRQKAG